MRERAAQELNPKIGRLGAEAPSRVFPAEPYCARIALIQTAFK